MPDGDELVALVFELKRRVIQGEVLYVHCRGGHGRTGTIVIPLVAALFDIEDAEASGFVCEATNRTRPTDAW